MTGHENWSNEKLLQRLATPAAGEAWKLFLRRHTSLVVSVARQYHHDDQRLRDCYLFVCEKLCDDGFRRLLAYRPAEMTEIDVYETLGGAFDDPQPPETTPVGTMTIDFSDCSNAQFSYALADGGVAGTIDISRLLAGGKALCEKLAGAQ